MSIPPLVCSSPPPPEQCEDEKEPEDFDFQYNSQPDDDDDSTSYNYDNFTSNTMYETETDSIENVKICENISDEVRNISPSPETEKTNNSIPHIPEDFERNSDLQEDCILEDLNLELTTECLQINAPDKINDENILSTDSSSTVNIQDEGGTDIDNVQMKSLSQSSNENEDLQILDNLSADISFGDDKQYNEEVQVVDNVTDSEKPSEEIQQVTLEQPLQVEFKTQDDDDFGDFDSFQCTIPKTANTQTYSILNVENPWDSQNDETQDFGDFTANFDNNEPFQPSQVSLIQENKSETKCDDIGESTYCDDDFGDFDDFKSSDKAVTINSPMLEDVSSSSNVFNFPVTHNETQFVENVNNVLVTIFPEEVVEPDNSLEANLELCLGETWGHLVDTDVRQPYMVNWNNTLGQKSLLKALCIDSRNILFGSRWNYNMPKFAANLSNSPLQPQKQPTQSGPESNTQVPDKDTNTWVDPFIPHGQEYTYAEALLLDLEHLMATLDQMAHKHSTLKISDLLSHACSAESETPVTEDKPKILDEFTSEIPSSTSKIYSSTLSVQPIRQINLPDTHIFTPTNSETPRSKTIHYDNNSRTVAANFETEIIKSESKSEPNQINTSSDKENEYWDFQHFKDSTSSNVKTTEGPASQISANVTSSQKTFATQILQPIKLEPITPTLNWPDPGEVKETFCDFSDFLSSTSVNNNNKQESSSTPDDRTVPSIKEHIKETQENIENDDDFETFQSAPLPTSSVDLKNIPENSPTITVKPEIKPVENYNLSEISTAKSSEVSSNINKVFKADTTINQKSISPQILTPITSQVNSLPVIQPNVLRTQQNSGQILQPLSLEGFSQINWPNPGIDFHDLSKFNPIESVHSLKSEASAIGSSKVSTPVHTRKQEPSKNEAPDDDWGDFVSSAPKHVATPKKTSTFGDDDEWTDFVSSPSVKPPNGLNTISFNVHTNLNLQKSQVKYPSKSNQINVDIPSLNYITPKSGARGAYVDKHFQNL